MIKAQIIGHIGRDAEMKDLNGDTCITFSVASQQGKDKNGNQRPSIWAKCTIWKKSGQSTEISKYLKTGTQIYCEGNAKSEHWKGRDGEPNSQLAINVSEIKLLESKQDNARTSDAPAAYAASSPVDAETPAVGTSDDLPF